MASKYQLKNNLFYYEGSDVPKNKFDIKNFDAIHEIEETLLRESYKIYLEKQNGETVFDEDYYKELHRSTFESLYEWAGEYRDFNMAKGESRFCQGAYVEVASKKIFEELAEDNYLKNFTGTKEEFANKLAYYKCELNALHPFYELNGRINRLFFDMIASYNGYEFINYSLISPKKYIDYAIDCVQYADSSGFESITLKGLKKVR